MTVHKFIQAVIQCAFIKENSVLFNDSAQIYLSSNTVRFQRNKILCCLMTVCKFIKTIIQRACIKKNIVVFNDSTQIYLGSDTVRCQKNRILWYLMTVDKFILTVILCPLKDIKYCAVL